MNQYHALKSLQDRLSPQSYARGPLQKIVRAGEALSQTADARAGEHPSQHAARLDKMSKQYAEAVQKARVGLEQAKWGGTAALMQERSERLGLKPDQFAQAIVQRFGAASHSERAQWLAQIAEQGDGRSMAALQAAPAYLTGLTREQLDSHTAAMESKFAPDLAEKREQFEADIDTANAALTAADNLAVEVTQYRPAEALAAADQLNAAQSVFAESLAD